MAKVLACELHQPSSENIHHENQGLQQLEGTHALDLELLSKLSICVNWIIRKVIIE
ncbi:hypothetical protein Fmac_002921 [Flemingia macrophylla]|uniref:Uncharacterized protein n=1 Tax=Flemingia macrophylla TaxID=520843 RepID=A0ABD1NLG5_9FABA